LLAVLILAAGKGTRMNSDLPKVLHTVGKKTLIEHVLRAAEQLEPDRLMVVIGHRREEVKAKLSGFKGIEWVVQEPQLGTGHAVQQSQAALDDVDGEIIVLSGDVPLLRANTLYRLLSAHRQAQAVATVLSTKAADPAAYGRIVRAFDGSFVKIVEAREATDDEREIHEINSGIYCFDLRALFDALSEIRADNSKGEYYLTDVIAILKQRGLVVQAVDLADFREVRGINTPEELEDAQRDLAAILATSST
jgi:UDP-N-acetylglucosamine diphosphorylase/glucosamine-1-phosphate N-acetyltransferase